jgi:uncharacterized protein
LGKKTQGQEIASITVVQSSSSSLAFPPLHVEVMKQLLEAAPHSDVVLVSAENEELHAHKGILAAHSAVNF